MQLTRHDIDAGEYAIPAMELLPDDAAERPPGIVMLPGLGGNKYQVLENMAHLAARGFATLSIDGPELGERRTERGIPRAPALGPEAHVALMEMNQQYVRDFRTTLDWWLGQGRIDADRLGAWGRSFGGNTLFYGLQGERRVKAATAIIGAPNRIDVMRRRLAALPEHGPEPTPEMWREIQERFGPLSATENVEKLSHVALLACWGADDPLMPIETVLHPFVERMAALPNPKAPFAYKVYDGAGHRATPEMQTDWTDWFEKHLKAKDDGHGR
jgi:dienelactone hydrolase